MHKKVSKSNDRNFSGISLMSNAGKVFLRIILNRLIGTIVNNILSDSQCSFRTNRERVGRIFSALKCRDQNIQLYHCFIDLSKALDTVNRSTLSKIFFKLGCPEKFVDLIWSLYDRMKARVGFGGALSDEKTAMKYLMIMVSNGDISAPMLLTIYFVYLDSTLAEECSFDNEISLRIEKASESFSGIEKRVYSQHGIKLDTKVMVYKACVWSLLLYASETWTLYKHRQRTLERLHQRCLRQILCIGWRSYTPDTKVLERAGLPSIESMVEKGCLCWFGHIVR